MRITVEATIAAPLAAVWHAWNTPADIVRWNAALDDWHCPAATVDLREGGRFSSRMEARDGSIGFDFEGTYTKVVPQAVIEYEMSDGRRVSIAFAERGGKTSVLQTFDAEGEHSMEEQRGGWQAILDRFARHVEATTGATG
jgi:uncharacterized protein YndB with AHSA1/START domain